MTLLNTFLDFPPNIWRQQQLMCSRVQKIFPAKMCWISCCPVMKPEFRKVNRILKKVEE